MSVEKVFFFSLDAQKRQFVWRIARGVLCTFVVINDYCRIFVFFLNQDKLIDRSSSKLTSSAVCCYESYIERVDYWPGTTACSFSE